LKRIKSAQIERTLSKKEKQNSLRETEEQQQQQILEISRDDSEDEFVSQAENRKLVEQAVLKIAHFLTLYQSSLRKILRPLIYDDKFDGHEFELVQFQAFSEFAEIIFKIDKKEVRAISVMLSDRFIGDCFDFRIFEEILQQMGL